MLLEETEEIGQQGIVQTVVTEVEDALHGALLTMLNHPLQVLGLQVGDAHMAHHALLLQLHQRRQRLVDNQLQPALAVALELDVVHVDQVDIVDVQALHALIHAVGHTLGRIVPRVDAVMAIAPHLRREIILVAGDALQRLAQHGLCLKVAVIGRHIDKVHTILHCRIHGLDTLFLADAVEHATQRRGPETQVRHLHAGLSDFIVYHNI